MLDAPDLNGDERHARRRRRRRQVIRRRIVTSVVIVGALAGGAVLVARTTGSHGSAQGGPTATSTVKEPTPEKPTTSTQGETDDEAVDRALERYVSLGLPVYRGGGKGKYVALTFDDGPGPMSPQLVDKLESHGFRATFFLCGTNVAGHRAVIRREARIGTLGDHTWNHPDLVRLPLADARLQMRSTQSAVTAASGVPTRLFRPPYGSHNRAIDREATAAGMLTVLWSVDTRDSLGASWDEILATLKRGTAPGAIILMHENHGQTQKALNRYLPWLQRQGYTAVTVPELLALDPPPVDKVRREARASGGARGGS